MNARIYGDGVAASCCESLLRRGGVQLSLGKANRRPKVPAVMLGATAQRLLSDVLEREDLFDGLPRIHRRITAWGTNSFKPLVFPHSAVVVSEEDLLARIHVLSPRSEDCTPEWRIYTSPPLPDSTALHHIGSRTATTAAVKLSSGCDHEACWIESVKNGWLFLLPNGRETGWLLATGGPVDLLLGESRLISDQVADCTATGGSFSSHPRITDPLGEPGWLACGTAALGFDPLCGDGLGNAVREAILACAVIRAAAAGTNHSAMVEHYRSRLLAGFRRHVEACRQFYFFGNSGPWWDNELEGLDRGLEWLSARTADPASSQFRLNGFVLEPIA